MKGCRAWTRSRSRRRDHDAEREILRWSDSSSLRPLASRGLQSLLGVSLPLEIERQLSHWFEPADTPERYSPAQCPIGLWEMPSGDFFATLPDEGHGVKCGTHHAGAPTSPETVNRTVSQEENAVARSPSSK